MADDRLKALLTLSEAELWRPLWEWPWDQRTDVLRARERRRHARWVPSEPGEVYRPSEAFTAVLDFADTE
jgi:hypothetical protein